MGGILDVLLLPIRRERDVCPLRVMAITMLRAGLYATHFAIAVRVLPLPPLTPIQGRALPLSSGWTNTFQDGGGAEFGVCCCVPTASEARLECVEREGARTFAARTRLGSR